MQEGEQQSVSTVHGFRAWLWTLSLGAPVAFLVGCLHEVSYWRAFHVSILQYLGIEDVIRLGIWPAIVLLPSFALLYHLKTQFEAGEQLSARNAALKLHVGAVYRRVYVATGIFSCILLFMFWWNGVVTEFLWAPLVLLGFIALLVLWGSPKALAFVQPEGARKLVVALLVMVPLLAWVSGKSRATQVSMGLNYNAATLTLEKRDQFGLPANAEARFLGHADAYDFLLIEGDVVRIVAAENNGLKLTRKEIRGGWHSAIRIPFLHPRRHADELP